MGRTGRRKVTGAFSAGIMWLCLGEHMGDELLAPELAPDQQKQDGIRRDCDRDQQPKAPAKSDAAAHEETRTNSDERISRPVP
jgi:hypothetical protein